MQPELIVFTAVTRSYDVLAPVPSSWQDKAKFIAFVEEDCDAPGWQLEPLDRRDLDPARAVRRYKLMPHLTFPGHKYSLWIDGSILIKEDSCPRHMIEKYLGQHDWAAFRHRKRKCIYEEAEACIGAGKDSSEQIRRQVEAYRTEGCPPDLGLSECTVLLRRNTPSVQKVSEEWFRQVLRYSKRDQISFNYVVWKRGFSYREFDGTIAKNDYFLRGKHRTSETPTPAIAGALQSV